MKIVSIRCSLNRDTSEKKRLYILHDLNTPI